MSASRGLASGARVPSISCIWAMSENGVIGRGGDLPWRIPADLRRFRELTMGHAIVMGRKTWESIGRPLFGRRSLVLSRARDYRAGGAEVVHSLDEALALAGATGDREVFVAGGAEVYRAALPRASRLYVTLVCAEVEGDVRLPEGAFEGFRLVEDEPHAADERNPHAYRFRVYERVGQGQHAEVDRGGEA
jgi:dihydrofolate reductase